MYGVGLDVIGRGWSLLLIPYLPYLPYQPSTYAAFRVLKEVRGKKDPSIIISSSSSSRLIALEYLSYQADACEVGGMHIVNDMSDDYPLTFMPKLFDNPLDVTSVTD